MNYMNFSEFSYLNKDKNWTWFLESPLRLEQLGQFMPRTVYQHLLHISLWRTWRLSIFAWSEGLCSRHCSCGFSIFLCPHGSFKTNHKNKNIFVKKKLKIWFWHTKLKRMLLFVRSDMLWRCKRMISIEKVHKYFTFFNGILFLNLFLFCILWKCLFWSPKTQMILLSLP